MKHVIAIFGLKLLFRLFSDLLIVNFMDIHPIDVADQILASKMTNLGIVESVSMNTQLNLFSQHVFNYFLNNLLNEW